MTKKNSNRKFFLGLTVAVLLPFSFYIIAKILKKDHLAMPPYYNISSVDSKIIEGKNVHDTQYHHVSELVACNQMGDTVLLNNDLTNKMLIVSLIQTQNHKISPIVTQNISYFLHRAFRKNDTTVQFISLSLDPENDSIEALNNFSKKYQINPDNWWFVASNSDGLKAYLANDLGINKIGQNKLNPILTDSNLSVLILIDKQRYVRGYYNALDTFDLKKCADDVGLISMQKKKR